MIASQQSYKEVLRRLRKRYKKSPTDFVHWSNPLELIMGTVLSAQCTDKRVNQVTRVLFKRYKTAAAYAQADLVKLKQIVRSTGFYNSKARYLKGIGTILVRDHGGNVPADYDALMQLPGVSNKTANLIMAKAFGINVGVAVDTHVKRIAPRIGWVTKTENTAKIERELNAIADPKDYLDLNEYLILLGRDVCGRTPNCAACPLNDLCKTGIKNTH
ncbi:endonuclease III [Candidatus Uhrbacteria bacterium CG10_big_fil_rev_8_21_14_0_10_50_16]|uniref:Endonuclease III n=1 Tax=Candidatus Uhrbacteria bacterium CG10_big_fil_rev_8_21_14_0_10_50_16 TaxID=1975039 RepID=A0A2H0RMF1_9BACT|nr:MAG: endonuclease III [Candidatus Uhrbacteria bacterium CG10_big_fil_rev_8_21_14_0_10_50_16]